MVNEEMHEVSKTLEEVAKVYIEQRRAHRTFHQSPARFNSFSSSIAQFPSSIREKGRPNKFMRTEKFWNSNFSKSFHAATPRQRSTFISCYENFSNATPFTTQLNLLCECESTKSFSFVPSPAFLHLLCTARMSSSFNRMFFDEKLVLKLFFSNKFFRAVWKCTFHVSATAESMC